MLDSDFLLPLLSIIAIDLTLSGDNAVVIGMVARQFHGWRRRVAILGGAFGAIIVRVLLTSGATLLLDLPLIQVIGAVLLVWIAISLLSSSDTHANESTGSKEDMRLIQAMGTILLADVTMSLDNILAIAGAAHGNLELVAIGLLLSITLLMIGGAGTAWLIDRATWLMPLGAAVIAWTAGGMLIEDSIVGPYLHRVPYASIVFPVLALGLALMLGMLFRRYKLSRQSSAEPAP